MVTAVGYSVLLRGFRLALSVKGLKPHTIRCYVRDVERVAHHHGQDPLSVTSADVRAYILQLQQRVAPKTVYEAQLALRRFFRFLVEEGEMSTDPKLSAYLTRIVRYGVTRCLSPNPPREGVGLAS